MTAYRLQTHIECFRGPLVFPVLLLALGSSLALPKGRLCCARRQGVSSQGDARCTWSCHPLSPPAAFPVSATFRTGRSLLDAHFPDSLMSSKAWATPCVQCKGKAGSVACPFLALPHQSTPESYLSEAWREGGRKVGRKGGFRKFY